MYYNLHLTIDGKNKYSFEPGSYYFQGGGGGGLEQQQQQQQAECNKSYIINDEFKVRPIQA